MKSEIFLLSTREIKFNFIKNMLFNIDKTTNEEFINIVRLELRPINCSHTVSYYNFTDDINIVKF